jgi:hypothetical protein
MDVQPKTPPEVPAPALDAQVQAAWATLLDRADTIADDITLTLIERDQQWYDAAGPEMRAELRSTTREHVRRGIRTMAGLADPDQRAVDVFRETGRRRARQGMPMEATLNAYTLGTRVLWEALLEQRHNPDVDINDDVLLLAGRQVWSALDVQNATLADSYRREAARLQRLDLHRQLRLIDGLVEGRGSDPVFAAEVHEGLGITPDEPVACVVGNFDGLMDEPLRTPEDHLERAGVMSYWHVRGEHYVGLVQLGDLGLGGLVDALAPLATGRVGVAGAPQGLAGFSTAFLLAAGTVETLPRGAKQVVAVTDRVPEVLLAASPQVTALLVEQTLGPLQSQPPHQAEVLLSTLRALVAHNGSPTHAAEQLYCHRNTVIYRMRQVRELTGRDLAKPRDRLQVALALLAVDR